MPTTPSLLERLLQAWHERGPALKALSFGLIGIINTLIDATVFFVALGAIVLAGYDHDASGALIAANVLAWLVAVSGSYVMNSFITFARESGRKLRWRDYGAFVASGVAGVVANTATLLIAAQLLSLPVWAAKGCAILVSFLVNFSLSHFVVFRRRAHPADDLR